MYVKELDYSHFLSALVVVPTVPPLLTHFQSSRKRSSSEKMHRYVWTGRQVGLSESTLAALGSAYLLSALPASHLWQE